MKCSIGDRICLQNEYLAVSILPGAGGNISGILDKRTGRNWLWQNSHIPLSQPRSGDDYGMNLDSGGWDEILLSITAAEIRVSESTTVKIADHGDLVRQAWSTETFTDQNGNDNCRMSASGKTLRYDFQRILTLHNQNPQFSLEYELFNKERFAWPWFWCAHALIDVQPDMRIRLPGGLPFRIEGDDDKSREHVWPTLDSDPGTTRDLSHSFAMNGTPAQFARKVFVRTPQSGAVTVEVPDTNESLTMQFDSKLLPWLGLWINNRGWSGCGSEPYTNLGLEPATTPYDNVADAVRNGEISMLQPGETRRWSIIVEAVA
jgi:hypothetical protein